MKLSKAKASWLLLLMAFCLASAVAIGGCTSAHTQKRTTKVVDEPGADRLPVRLDIKGKAKATLNLDSQQVLPFGHVTVTLHGIADEKGEQLEISLAKDFQCPTGVAIARQEVTEIENTVDCDSDAKSASGQFCAVMTSVAIMGFAGAIPVAAASYTADSRINDPDNLRDFRDDSATFMSISGGVGTLGLVGALPYLMMSIDRTKEVQLPSRFQASNNFARCIDQTTTVELATSFGRGDASSDRQYCKSCGSDETLTLSSNSLRLPVIKAVSALESLAVSHEKGEVLRSVEVTKTATKESAVPEPGQQADKKEDDDAVSSKTDGVATSIVPVESGKGLSDETSAKAQRADDPAARAAAIVDTVFEAPWFCMESASEFGVKWVAADGDGPFFEPDDGRLCVDLSTSEAARKTMLNYQSRMWESMKGDDFLRALPQLVKNLKTPPETKGSERYFSADFMVVSLRAYAKRSTGMKKLPKDVQFAGEGAVRTLAYFAIKDQFSPDKIRTFIKVFPNENGHYYGKVDEVMWRAQSIRNTVPSYMAYVADFPNGKFLRKAGAGLAASCGNQALRDRQACSDELGVQKKLCSVQENLAQKLCDEDVTVCETENERTAKLAKQAQVPMNQEELLRGIAKVDCRGQKKACRSKAKIQASICVNQAKARLQDCIPTSDHDLNLCRATADTLQENTHERCVARCAAKQVSSADACEVAKRYNAESCQIDKEAGGKLCGIAAKACQRSNKRARKFKKAGAGKTLMRYYRGDDLTLQQELVSGEVAQTRNCSAEERECEAQLNERFTICMSEAKENVCPAPMDEAHKACEKHCQRPDKSFSR